MSIFRVTQATKSQLALRSGSIYRFTRPSTRVIHQLGMTFPTQRAVCMQTHTRRLYVMGTIPDRFLAMSRTPGAEVVSLVDVTGSLAVGKTPVGLLRFAKRADVHFIVGGLRRSVRIRKARLKRMAAA